MRDSRNGLNRIVISKQAASANRRLLASVTLLSGFFACLTPRLCSAASPEGEAAQGPVRDEENASPRARRWYGEQTFSADAVAGAFFLGAVAAHDNPVLYGVSGLTFALGAPVIHVVHGHWDLAFASFGLRLAGPLIGGALGSQLDSGRASSDGSGASRDSSQWTTACVALGGVIASAIDGFGLSYDAPASETKAPRNQLLEGSPLPQVGLKRNGVSFGFSGRF